MSSSYSEIKPYEVEDEINRFSSFQFRDVFHFVNTAF